MSDEIFPRRIISGIDANVAMPIVVEPATTGTRTSTADSGTVVTVLAANAARRGATLFNDSTEIAYVALGSAATTTDFTVKMAAGDYYEVPFGYTGIITSIWANNASGSMRVTELT